MQFIVSNNISFIFLRIREKLKILSDRVPNNTTRLYIIKINLSKFLKILKDSLRYNYTDIYVYILNNNINKMEIIL